MTNTSLCRNNFLTNQAPVCNVVASKRPWRLPDALNLAYPPHHHQKSISSMSCSESVRPETAMVGGDTTHWGFLFEVNT